MPCRACYGSAERAADQGAKMLCAIASVLNIVDEADVAKTLNSIADPLGTFCRFPLPTSLLEQAKVT